MAAPTWRPVDAPNFGGAISGIQTSHQMVGQSLNGLGNLLSGIQARRDTANDNQVLQNILQYSDPEAYRAALASGDVYGGVDRNRLSAGVLQALGSRTSALQSERANDLGYKSSLYNQNRTESINALRDAAAPGVGALLAAEASGQQPMVQSALGKYANALSALPLEDQVSLATGRRAASQHALSQAKGTYDLEQLQINDTTRREANSAISQLLQESVDPSTAMSAVHRLSKGLNGDGRVALADAASKAFPGLFSSATGSAAAGGGGRPAAGTFDRDALHAAQMKQESLNNPTARSNKGAYGLMQLMPATAREWEKKLGLPSGSTDTNPAANEQVGRAYMDHLIQRYGGNTADALAAYNWGMGNVDRWIKNGRNMAALPKETRDYLTKILPQNAAASPAQLADSAQQLTDQILRRYTQNNVNGNPNQIRDLEGDTSSVSQVAKRLFEDKELGSRYSQDAIASMLNDVMQRGKVNAAQGGQILSDSLRDRSLTSRLLSVANPLNLVAQYANGRDIGSLLSPRGVDSRVVEDRIRELNDPTYLQNLSQNRASAQTVQQLESAVNQLQSRQQDLNAVIQRNRVAPSPALQEVIQERYAELQKLQQQVQSLQQLVNATPTNRPIMNGPQEIAPIDVGPLGRSPRPRNEGSVSQAEMARRLIQEWDYTK